MVNRLASLLAASLSMAALVGPAIAQDKSKDQPATETNKDKEPVKTLSVGDAAPKLQVEKFLKGDAVTGFEKGKVYVVEFWATWCGPCRKAFPHLSELQAKHKGKVTFIGVNVWEDQEYNDETLDKVTEFVKAQGDKMAYTVAYDGKDKKTDMAYMKAAGRSGIPSSFVVDGSGKVAWIGHPMGLDPVIDDVLAGKWDLEKARKEANDEKDKAAKAKDAAKKAQPIIERLRDAQENEKWDDALKALDELKALDSERFATADLQKFMILLKSAKQPDKAYAMKDALLANKQITSNSQLCNQIAWTVVDPEGDVKNPNVDFAMAFAVKADEAAEHKNAAIIDTLARCHWLKGDKAKAIELQEKAVKLAKDDADMEDMAEDLAKTLKTYKEQK